MKKRLLLTLPLCFAPAAIAQAAVHDPTHSSVPMCKADQLSLGTDAENGNFDGMSHSGTLLVLRNLGPGACRVEPFPKIVFLKGNQVLEAEGQVSGARYMHPGPVVFPEVVAAGAEITASLRWVSGEVYDKSVCLEPDAIAVQIGTGKQQTDFSGHLCGEAGKTVSYEKTRFAVDPVYTGK